MSDMVMGIISLVNKLPKTTQTWKYFVKLLWNNFVSNWTNEIGNPMLVG